MKYLNKIIPTILFAVISLVIVFPLLSPGYILALDIPITEKVMLPSITNPGFLINVIFYLLHLIIPNYLIQKILLFLSLFLAGWSMARFIPVKNIFARIFAGLLYMINPFTYERIVSGQWLFILGYSILPLAFSVIINFFQNPTLIRIMILSLLTVILSTISFYFFVIMGVFFLIYFVIYMFFQKDNNKKMLFGVGKLLLLCSIFNINWIIGFFMQFFQGNTSFSFISYEDIIAFQSVPDATFGLIYNLLAGFGFWAEANSYFISPKAIFPFWPIITPIFIGTAIYGLYILVIKKQQTVIGISLGVLFLLALDFSIGVASKHFAQAAYFLYEKIFFLRIFREPQKLVGVIMFSYAFFGGIGVAGIFDLIKNKAKYFIICFFLILPFIYTPVVFGGYWGQLKPVFYPKSWDEVNELIKKDKDNFMVVFFPWHQYMRFNFANNKVVANPALYFFDKPIISSQNYETISLYTHDTRFESLHIEGLLNIEKEGINLLGEKIDKELSWGESLAPINVKYIILAKEDDWIKYRFLNRSEDLKNIYESDDILLYQNLSYGKEINLEENQEFENIEEPISSSEQQLD